MASPAETRAAVDSRLAALWAPIQAREDAYLGAHGRYWQGLRTHSAPPADGATALPTIGLTCPTDQLGEPWPESIRTLPIEMALRIDVYERNDALGYVATVEVGIGTGVWERAAQVGPDTWRAFAWRERPLGRG